MKISKLSFLLVTFFVVFSSCEKEEEAAAVNCTTVGTEALDMVNRLLEAQEKWTDDPTPANCTAYVSAVEDYVDLVRQIVADCSLLSASYETILTQYEQILANAKAECNS